MRRRTPALTALALLLALLSACAPDFIDPWEVVEPRLMGSRVEVEGAPERSRPRLTDRFALRQFLAVPPAFMASPTGRYSIDLAVCLGLRTAGGTLACIAEQELDPVLVPVSETELLVSGLAFDLTKVKLPDNATLPIPGDLGGDALSMLEDLDRLVLFGALCVDGRAERVAERSVQDAPPSQLFRCVDNAGAMFPDPSPFTISILLDRGRPPDANQNPSFACDPAVPDSVCNLGVERPNEPRVPGAFVIARPRVPNRPGREVLPWPQRELLPLPWTGCKGDPTLPQIPAASGEHIVRVRFDRSDREEFQGEIEVNGQRVLRPDREALVLTHAITANGGQLDRFDSRLDPGDPESEAEISFRYRPPKRSQEPDKVVPKDGRLVRFYFTLRDERGGVDFTTRELCLVEPEQQG